MITYHTQGNVKMPKINKTKCSKWIKDIALSHDKKIGEIVYIFCSDEYILQVNKDYLQHDYYTDVITFDYSDTKKIAGDIFISLDTIKSNSEQFNTEYNDELARIIIHGILHLCGFKDKQPAHKQEMTKQENTALAVIPDMFTK